MHKIRVVVVGSINMDLVVQSDRMPAIGETVTGNRFTTIPGGKGANQAVAAARLGADVSMIGCIGNDDFGKQLQRQLADDGVDTSRISTINEMSSGVALIQVRGDGDNSITVVPGANGHLGPRHVEAAEDIIRAADVLLVQLEIPLQTVERALEIAASHGVKTILNPAPAQALSESILSKVHLLTPNETEAALLSGISQDRPIEEIHTAIRRFLPNGDVIITGGSKGVYYGHQGKLSHAPAFKVKAVDTTAAGDCFNAALGVRLGEGAELREAIRFASKAAAISVTRFGAQTSLPSRDEVESWN